MFFVSIMCPGCWIKQMYVPHCVRPLSKQQYYKMESINIEPFINLKQTDRFPSHLNHHTSFLGKEFEIEASQEREEYILNALLKLQCFGIFMGQRVLPITLADLVWKKANNDQLLWPLGVCGFVGVCVSVCVHVVFDTDTTSVCLVWDDAHELQRHRQHWTAITIRSRALICQLIKEDNSCLVN